MTGSIDRTTRALVVGAGPVGLLCALRLACRGVEVTVVERQERRQAASFAVVLHPKTVAMLADFGVTDPLLWQGQSFKHVAVVADGERRALLEVPTAGELAHGGLTLPQNVLRKALEGALHAQGVDILYQHRLLSLEEHGGKVRCLMSSRRRGDDVAMAGETTESVVATAEVVIGADGCDSAVRRALGVSLTEYGPARHFAFFDVAAEPLAGSNIDLVLAELSAAAYPLHGGASRYTFELPTLLPAGISGPSLRELRAARMPWRSPEIENPEWAGSRTFRRTLAERMGRGRVWLVGDACHTTCPHGAQSVNVGLREARDLADLAVEGLNRGDLKRLEVGYETQRQLEWRRLLVASPSTLGPRTPEWVRRHLGDLLAFLPASGDELDDLLEQLGVTLL